MEDSSIMFKATGISKSYGKKKVLSDINLTVKRGEIYGLVGKNGAGKTTLMRIMTGLQPATEGTIEYGFEKRRYGDVGSLVETPSIYLNKTARENLEFQYMNLGLKPDSSLDETLRFVGLDNTGKKKAGKFSLGMRQRLGIAMAIVGNPEMLILDEPINGLDPQGIINIRDLILRLNQQKNMTVVISSHILSELSKLATSFGFIDGGRIVKEATAYEIEHANEKQILLECDRAFDLAAFLVSKGLNAETDTNPGKVTIHGEVDFTDVLIEAKAQGFVIKDIHNIETDLEDYFVSLVGGETHA